MARLKTEGKEPVDRDVFMMARMWGEIEYNASLKILVGIGSSLHDDGFIEEIVFSKDWLVTGENWLKETVMFGKKGGQLVSGII